jgi:hypothetical protein
MNNSPSSKTISLLLADGHPGGIKIARISGRIIRAVQIPRAMLASAKDQPELTQPAVYLLSDEPGANVYIGESENFLERVKTHDINKDFWETAIAFVSSDGSLNKADIRCLEAYAYELAVRADRCKLLNGTRPKAASIDQFDMPMVRDFFEDMQLLTSTLGLKVFDRVNVERADAMQHWFCRTHDTNAEAIQDENGFTVLKGSVLGPSKPSFAVNHPFGATERQELLAKKARVIDATKQQYELLENVTFKSANKAGGFCVGSSVNAWVTWKNAAGETMDKVLRRGLEAAA